MQRLLYRSISIVYTALILSFLYCITMNWVISKDDGLKSSIQNAKLLNVMDIQGIYQAARSIKSRPVLITLVNDAYIPFLRSWLCNTKHMGVHEQVLIITTCDDVTAMLMKSWPNVKVAKSSMNLLCGNQDFSRIGYLKLMIRRTEILLALLEIHMEILLFEVDSVWLKNPIPFLKKMKEYDIITGGNTGISEVTGGFLYLMWSEKTINIIRHLDEEMLKLKRVIRGKSNEEVMSHENGDQFQLSKLLSETDSSLKKVVLNLSDFADGMWYCLPRETRRHSHPYIINNNWVVGNINKVNRAKMWGHWFINEQNKCNLTQIKNVVFEWGIQDFEPTDAFLFSPCQNADNKR